MIDATDATENSHSWKVENYYRFHSRFYDVTRWSFLFGRKAIVNTIPDLPPQPRIMEVGCGTGKNLELLAHYFPDAQILGVDLSDEMLEIARNKRRDSHAKLLRKAYGTESAKEEPFDLILLSYSLTMMGCEYRNIFDDLVNDLKPGGYIAVVDFYTSPFRWFRRWMELNHVDFGGTLLPLLKRNFEPVQTEINQAYLGLWSYFLFIGQQKTTG